jgi:hypothetical protein
MIPQFLGEWLEQAVYEHHQSFQRMQHVWPVVVYKDRLAAFLYMGQ